MTRSRVSHRTGSRAERGEMDVLSSLGMVQGSPSLRSLNVDVVLLIAAHLSLNMVSLKSRLDNLLMEWNQWNPEKIYNGCKDGSNQGRWTLKAVSLEFI
jgi:hypothetical protein